MKSVLSGAILFSAVLFSCAQNSNKETKQTNTKKVMKDTTNLKPTGVATFANGCFWCTEAVFEELKGVISVVSGYTGGNVDNPTYEQVSYEQTGHAECAQITFDTSVITYDELLEVFWETHDPTTLNRQGGDVGTQYRSAIFYHDDEQKQKAEQYKAALDKSGAWDKPVVTEIVPFTKFYSAEEYHQQYYELNKNKNPYCAVVIRPKLEKFRKVFASKLKN
ncbi:MAG: peptide-methionine (S)-S-oxide reductase MsrA [Bacteroidetes bacterium]|nr:MAG: peptide-methionine (S)-S-oxide reductase MsrA [Bacteroidota bacterium]